MRPPINRCVDDNLATPEKIEIATSFYGKEWVWAVARY